MKDTAAVELASSKKMDVEKRLRSATYSILLCEVVDYLWVRAQHLYYAYTDVEAMLETFIELDVIDELSLVEKEAEFTNIFNDYRRLPRKTFTLISVNFTVGKQTVAHKWNSLISIKLNFNRAVDNVTTEEESPKPLSLTRLNKKLRLKKQAIEFELEIHDLVKYMWSQFAISHRRPMNKEAIVKGTLRVMEENSKDIDSIATKFLELFTEVQRLQEDEYSVETISILPDEKKKNLLRVELVLKFNRETKKNTQ
jgi:hypothetical protein